MLFKRVISALAGIFIFILFIFWGPLPFALLIAVLAVLALREYNSFNPVGDGCSIFFSIFFLIHTYLTSTGIVTVSGGLFPTALILVFFIYQLLIGELNGFLSRTGFNLLGLLYTAGGFSFFVLLRNFTIHPFTGTRALWLVLLAAWATDTGAYFSGSFFGRTRLAPLISPNKTVEGAVGGVLFCMLVVTAYTVYLGVFHWYWLIYALLAGLLCIGGDLFESGLKRDSGIKDSGKIIPGHGGILDRFDSLLFSAPFTYYYLLVILG